MSAHTHTNAHTPCNRGCVRPSCVMSSEYASPADTMCTWHPNYCPSTRYCCLAAFIIEIDRQSAIGLSSGYGRGVGTTNQLI